MDNLDNALGRIFSEENGWEKEASDLFDAKDGGDGMSDVNILRKAPPSAAKSTTKALELEGLPARGNPNTIAFRQGVRQRASDPDVRSRLTNSFRPNSVAQMIGTANQDALRKSIRSSQSQPVPSSGRLTAPLLNTAVLDGGHNKFRFWKGSTGQLRHPTPYRVEWPRENKARTTARGLGDDSKCIVMGPASPANVREVDGMVRTTAPDQRNIQQGAGDPAGNLDRNMREGPSANRPMAEPSADMCDEDGLSRPGTPPPLQQGSFMATDISLKSSTSVSSTRTRLNVVSWEPSDCAPRPAAVDEDQLGRLDGGSDDSSSSPSSSGNWDEFFSRKNTREHERRRSWASPDAFDLPQACQDRRKVADALESDAASIQNPKMSDWPHGGQADGKVKSINSELPRTFSSARDPHFSDASSEDSIGDAYQEHSSGNHSSSDASDDGDHGDLSGGAGEEGEGSGDESGDGLQNEDGMDAENTSRYRSDSDEDDASSKGSDELFDYFLSVADRMKSYSQINPNQLSSSGQSLNSSFPVEVFPDEKPKPGRSGPLVPKDRILSTETWQARKRLDVLRKVPAVDILLKGYSEVGIHHKRPLVPSKEPKPSCQVKHSPIQASADAPRGLKPGKFIQPQSQQLPPIRKTSPQEVPEWKAVAMSLESYDLAKSIDGAWKGMTNKDARSRDEEDDLMPAGDEVSDFSRRFAVDSMTSPATATGSFSRLGGLGFSIAGRQGGYQENDTMWSGDSHPLADTRSIEAWHARKPGSAVADPLAQHHPHRDPQLRQTTPGHSTHRAIPSVSTPKSLGLEEDMTGLFSWLDEFSEEMHGASHADEEGLDLGRLESMEDLGGQSGPARLRLCPHLTGKQLGANPDDEEGSEHADRREAATEKTMEADHGPNIPPAPAPNGNIVSSSRSKMFDRAAGFDGGHRGKPEMHAAMSEAQLQDIISQIYAQVAEDYRTISLTAGITRTLSPAQREARRQRQQNNMADNDRGSTWSYATWLGSMHGQDKDAETEAKSPQEKLLQLALSRKVSEDTLASTLQRQGHDIQDGTVRLFANFLARSGPQNRCQVASMCAVADMTAFANILVASKLEVAEDMLLHPPKTLDEAHLLSCTLALDWGENDAIDVQPDTEAVLLGVYNCLSCLDERMGEQRKRLQQMRVRRGNAAALSQAAQRIVLGTLSGLAALEEQVSELFTGMVSCSKFLLIGYRASEKAMYIRGERTALETGALSTSILEKASINIEDAGTDERLTEHDLRSILTAFPKARIQSLLAVPVLHKRGTDQRPRCVGLMVAVNKKGKTEDKRLPKFVDADKAAMRKAGAVLSPAVVAALSHSDMTISRENISARNLKSRSILQFSASVFKSLDPKELWRTITEEAPPVIGCELAILYIYVENGILALLNPEGDVLEFITLGEAGVVGELFKNSTPKYLSTRTHAVREKQKTGSAAVKRVAIQEGARPHAYGSPIEEQAPCLTPETSSLSEKRPQSRDEDWDPNDENESLNGCILPTLTTRISTMLLVPLRHRVHRDEARKLRAQLGGKDDGGDSDDSDEEYLEKHDKQYADATWGVLAAINREKSHEQDKQLTVQRKVRSIIQSRMSSFSPLRRRSRLSTREMTYPEFTANDESFVETLGNIIYPAVINSQMRQVLQYHLQQM